MLRASLELMDETVLSTFCFCNDDTLFLKESFWFGLVLYIPVNSYGQFSPVTGLSKLNIYKQ